MEFGLRQELPGGDVSVAVRGGRDGGCRALHYAGRPLRTQARAPGLSVGHDRHRRGPLLRARVHQLLRAALHTGRRQGGKRCLIVFFKRLGRLGFHDLFNQYIFAFQNIMDTAKYKHKTLG